MQPRRVTFRDTLFDFHTARSDHTIMVDEESMSSWYSRDELEQFHEEARQLSRQQILENEESGGSIRGLELRRSKERKKQKMLTTYCIIMAQRQMQDPQKLAVLAQRCSAWAVRVAIVEGQRDFIIAYSEGGDVELPKNPPSSSCPLPFKLVPRTSSQMRRKNDILQPSRPTKHSRNLLNYVETNRHASATSAEAKICC